MPRPRNKVPSYRLHKPRNCGKVIVGRRTVYFPGPFRSPQSLDAYNHWLANYLTTGEVARPDVTGSTVNDLVLRFFREMVTVRYVKHGKPTSEQQSYRIALRPVVNGYGHLPAADFLPVHLLACRDKLVEARYTRQRINQHVTRIRRCFGWGVVQGTVPETTWRALQAVEGLRKGEADVPERSTVLPALEADVAAVEPFVTPPVWAMIRLQLWTGCRPGEACSIRTCDVQADDDALPPAVRDLCWVYRPAHHKTEHHGRGRLVLLGPQAVEIVQPWLRPEDPTAYLFSPAEARAWYNAQRRANAARPPRERCRKKKPRRRADDRYSASSYNEAIRRACVRAGVPHWHPNQLRHTAATKIRAAYGADVAQTILGHANLKTTEVYAERDLDAAARAIARLG